MDYFQYIDVIGANVAVLFKFQLSCISMKQI